jgi:hypothetical protein
MALANIRCDGLPYEACVNKVKPIRRELNIRTDRGVGCQEMPAWRCSQRM